MDGERPILRGRRFISVLYARAMAVRLLDFLSHWTAQILVLWSLALQFILLFLAGSRRHKASIVKRTPLWIAYQLADYIATYAIGHLSVNAKSSGHRLVAFWAPFLLLHLGGPDTICAYALQDNQLWLRHLLGLIVQVLGACYALYKHAAGVDNFLLLAAILMSIVGFVKYVEKIHSLKCGNIDSIRSSLKKDADAHAGHHHFYPLDGGFREKAIDEEEIYVRRAHSLFYMCKRAMVDSWVEKDSQNYSVVMLKTLRKEDYKGMWTLMEMELSLMYDILYTKAAVIYTCSGYCIRFASSLAVTASFLLFQFGSKDGHSRVDVAVTYTLLAGAVIMETGSLLSALGSTWTYAFLCATPRSWLRYTALCTGRWDRLRRLVKTIKSRGGRKKSVRSWSGKIGQYNMLHFCSRRDRACIPLLGTLAQMVGQEEWWIRYRYSGTINISDDLKNRLFGYIKTLTRTGSVNTQGVIRKNWGQEVLQKVDKDLYKYFKDNTYLGVEFQEGIIIWHIGTDVFLAESSGADANDAADLVKAIRTLSNYMMFLLVEHPYMLPGLGQSMLYRRTCENLADLWKKEVRDSSNWNICSMLKELFSLHDEPKFAELMHRDDLAQILYKERPRYSPDVPRLYYANKVAEKLLETQKKKGSKAVLELVLYLWIDFLVYAANRCSRESHAEKLSSGRELTTIVWLMTDYLHQEEAQGVPEVV